jgi:hypothetical protein
VWAAQGGGGQPVGKGDGRSVNMYVKLTHTQLTVCSYGPQLLLLLLLLLHRHKHSDMTCHAGVPQLCQWTRHTIVVGWLVQWRA